MPKPAAAIYARISRDAKGEGLGVERQEQDCKKLARKLGWRVVATYVDNDISAHSGKRRPQYEAMLKAIEAGKINAILAYHPDRLHRRSAELEDFVPFVEEHGTEIQTVSQGQIDLSTPSGRMVARIVGATSQHEVDRMKERLSRSKLQMLENGNYRGGPRPFGFEKDGMTHREDEAEVIRETAQGVIAGRTLAAMAKELNEAGKTTSTGNTWTYARLKEMLVRPRNAGLSARGTPGRRPTPGAERREFEEFGAAQWEAILPEDEWRTVVSILTDPSRKRQNGNDARWLGSGLYKCGRDGCGGNMRTAPYRDSKKPKAERKHLYRCTAAAHLTIGIEKTDKFVRAVTCELLRDPGIAARMQPADQQIGKDRKHRAALVNRLEQAEQDYAEGYLTGKQLSKTTQQIEAQLEDVDQRLSKALSSSATAEVLSSTDPAQAFMDAPIDVQKAVIRALMTVTIMPSAKRGTPHWSSERVQCVPIQDQ